jgi:hypothetical protein
MPSFLYNTARDRTRKEPSMTEPKSIEGSCHCKKVRFRATPDLASVISCNCSICSQTGALLTFVPVEQFELLSGADELTDYTFNKHKIHHLFCKTCGIRSFARGTGPDGREMRAINVRSLEGVDLDALTVTKVDGRSF